MKPSNSSYDIRIVPTYSEDGSVITFVLANSESSPISKEQIIMILEEYINYLSYLQEEAN